MSEDQNRVGLNRPGQAKVGPDITVRSRAGQSSVGKEVRVKADQYKDSKLVKVTQTG